MRTWSEARKDKVGGMSKKRKKQKRSQGSSAFLVANTAYQMLCGDGFTTLDKNPEILTGCQKIAELIASMTIYLMENKESGDKRINNELSKHIDIYPNKYMTRFTWMQFVVMNMLVYGKGNSVVIPMTESGLLGDLVPVPASRVTFVEDGWGYKVMIGTKEVDPMDVLHFVYNPDKEYPWKGAGLTVSAKDVVKNLKQASETEKAFMESKWMPNLVVKVDGLTEEFSNKAGRTKLLESYIETSEKGQPWMIPADLMAIEQVKPLTLQDIALNDSVKLNKQSVAAILGVPAFLLGVGQYSSAEWDNFVSSKIRPIAKLIEQEMTRKLLISNKWYFKFNVSSLYSYDLKTTEEVYSDLYVKGIVDGNEVRDKMSLSPREGLDTLVILENYIPLDKVGDQLKLKQEE